MMFVFAFVGVATNSALLAMLLMYLTEAAFIAVAFICFRIAVRSRASGTQHPWRDGIAVAGGISASFGLIMPFELAPFFFGVRGEWMLATMGLILVYPIAALLFIAGLYKLMKVNRGGLVPPPLPNT